MARYADRAALEARFGAGEVAELLSRFVDGGDVDAALASQLAEVDSLMDSYLRAAHKLPLRAVPEVLRGIACDIARYRLYQEPTATVSERHASAMRTLRDIADGRVRLGVTPPASTPGRVAHAPGQSRLGLEAY